MHWKLFDYSYIYIYIYVFSRRFYPKRLTVHSGYNFFLSVFLLKFAQIGCTLNPSFTCCETDLRESAVGFTHAKECVPGTCLQLSAILVSWLQANLLHQTKGENMQSDWYYISISVHFVNYYIGKNQKEERNSKPDAQLLNIPELEPLELENFLI